MTAEIEMPKVADRPDAAFAAMRDVACTIPLRLPFGDGQTHDVEIVLDGSVIGRFRLAGEALTCFAIGGRFLTPARVAVVGRVA